MPDSSQRGEKPSILVAEDEGALRTMLRYNQEKEGFCIEEAESGREALAKIAAAPPDLVILDWMLPVLSGIEVCRGVRRAPAIRDVRILMVSARTAERDAVHMLDAGADDYVTKPFAMDTLLARIRALLRRASGQPRSQGTLTFHDLGMDLGARRVWRAGRAVDLGPTGYRLLEFLLLHPRRVFAREELVNALWGQDARVEFRTADVHVRRLRQALNEDRERTWFELYARQDMPSTSIRIRGRKAQGAFTGRSDVRFQGPRSVGARRDCGRRGSDVLRHTRGSSRASA